MKIVYHSYQMFAINTKNWEIKQICHDEGFNERFDTGFDTGFDKGFDKGLDVKLVEDVENAMNSFHVDLQTACEGLKTTVEKYEKAKDIAASAATNSLKANGKT